MSQLFGKRPVGNMAPNVWAYKFLGFEGTWIRQQNEPPIEPDGADWLSRVTPLEFSIASE